MMLGGVKKFTPNDLESEVGCMTLGGVKKFTPNDLESEVGWHNLAHARKKCHSRRNR